MLQHLGAYTIDADGLSNQAMQPGAPAYKPVVEKFGMFILDEEKRINRKALANVVFSNEQALAQLEAIVHPIVRQATDTLVKRARQRVVVIEAIKLLEGDFAEWVDAVWVVDAPQEAQLKRLISKRKMTAEEASMRIKAQNPQADKLARADVVIKNDGNVEDTWKQVQTAWGGVKQEVIRRYSKKQPTGESDKPTAEPPAQVGSIAVKRGMPSNADAVAKFISKHSTRDVSRMDVMMSFGQKSYLLAETEKDGVVAVLGWQVENLITRADEFYLDDSVPKEKIITAITDEVESASGELQSEVSFIFLPNATPTDTVNTFRSLGYELTGIRDIKIPAWREAVQETLSENDGLQILMKKLREDRVLKPI
jgi:dephospho-CoA kinase